MRNTSAKNPSKRLYGRAKVSVKSAVFGKKILPSAQTVRTKNLPA